MPRTHDDEVSSFRDSDRRRRLVLAGTSMLALGIALNVPRLFDEPAPSVDAMSRADATALETEDLGGDGARHRGEEGMMGRISPPANAIPQMARTFDPSMAARNSGILGQMQQESGHFLASPYGGAFAVGNDDGDVWGGLTGTEVGEAYGVGGLGMVGTGRGGGGTGEGTIGLGTYGLIGKGGGGGDGSGYGHGAGSRRTRGQKAARVRAPGESVGGTHAVPPKPVFETGFVSVSDDPMSTFSIDVDTASYSATRRELRQGSLPAPEAVRIEELINYFDYSYAAPTGDAPFSITTEVGECPWNSDHQLIHVGLQGKEIAADDLPARNLVFLVDVSGSMSSYDKLPLVKRSLAQLTKTLRAEDRISLVVYAGAAGVVLPPTSGADRDTILAAVGRLEAGGSTNGSEGLELAYAQARTAFLEDGVNRVLLASDGDFNVGVSSHDALVEMIEEQRRSGVELSVLGYGMGHRDHTMEQLADKGNGNYAYIDGPEEAHKVLVEQAGGTLVTIAKDVKIQVELDPARVSSYRLVGYDNRRLAHRDFADDTKDAGEIGAGHSVTALYEVVPRAGADEDAPWMELKLRYKKPKGERSSLLRVPVVAEPLALARTSDDFRFSAAVASFGMLLRGSEYKGEATWAGTQEAALEAVGDDPSCRRHEFVELAGLAGHVAGDIGVTTGPIRCVPGAKTVSGDEATRTPTAYTAPAASLEREAESSGGGDLLEWVLEVLRLLPPLLALPLFVMALRRPRRRD